MESADLDKWRIQQVNRQLDKHARDEQSYHATLDVTRGITSMSDRLVERYITEGWDYNADPCQDLGHQRRLFGAEQGVTDE
jgi:hypothetical protein